MFPLSESLDPDSNMIATEAAEFDALGGIRWDQVIGWNKFSIDANPEELQADKEFTANPKYSEKYDQYSASGPQPQLNEENTDPAKGKTAYDYAIDMLNSVGEAVGWTGSLPLFTSSDHAEVKAREEAAVNKAGEAADYCRKAVNEAKDLLETVKASTSVQQAAAGAERAAKAAIKASKFAKTVAALSEQYPMIGRKAYEEAVSDARDARQYAGKAVHTADTYVAKAESKRIKGLKGTVEEMQKETERLTSMKEKYSEALLQKINTREEVEKLKEESEFVNSYEMEFDAKMSNLRQSISQATVWAPRWENALDALWREDDLLKMEIEYMRSTIDSISIALAEAEKGRTRTGNSQKDKAKEAAEKDATQDGEPQTVEDAFAASEKEQKAGETVPKSAPVKHVFYGNYLWPHEVKQQGGFLTPADQLKEAPASAYNLRTHLFKERLPEEAKSFYLSTSKNFGTAAKQAADSAAKATQGFGGVVYLVHATPNMIDVAQTLKEHGETYSKPAEQELAVAGGIEWPQVMGWLQVPHDQALPSIGESVAGLKGSGKQGLKEHFARAFDERTDLFHRNEDYDRERFGDQTASGQGQAQLLDAKDPKRELQTFMKQAGDALRWSGDFPLFETPKKILPHESAEAKAVQAVPPPHEDVSWWSKAWSFIKSHALAIALLPAVAAANLIPGLGEVADGAEIALLGAEGASETLALATEGVAEGVAEGAAEGVAEGTAEGTTEGIVEKESADVAEKTLEEGQPVKSVQELLDEAPDTPVEEPGESVEELLEKAPDPPTEEPGESVEQLLEKAPRPPKGAVREPGGRVKLPAQKNPRRRRRSVK
ncbi:putative enterotoxin [Cordyceps sp. RAO-2017]|nr:putative enterotoxin [Cordyceps sp. RAO-2017]